MSPLAANTQGFQTLTMGYADGDSKITDDGSLAASATRLVRQLFKMVLANRKCTYIYNKYFACARISFYCNNKERDMRAFINTFLLVVDAN